MNLQNKYMLFCALVFILIPVVLSTLTGNITASDWTYRHEVWIHQYLEGDFTPILKYPPLFQWMMMPFVALNFPMQWFQVVFISLATLGLLYMANRLEGEKATIYFSILLASSISFIEFGSALMPQALDYFFFSLAIIFYYQNRVKIVIPLLCIIFFMHIMGSFFVLILFLHALLTKRYRFAKYLMLLGIVFFMFSAFYSRGFYYYYTPETEMDWNIKTQAEWDNRYLDPIYNLFFFSGFMTWIILPYAIYRLRKRNFKITENQKLYIIWYMVFFILMFLQQGVWRCISYQMIPLGLLVASVLSKDEKNDGVV